MCGSDSIRYIGPVGETGLERKKVQFKNFRFEAIAQLGLEAFKVVHSLLRVYVDKLGVLDYLLRYVNRTFWFCC